MTEKSTMNNAKRHENFMLPLDLQKLRNEKVILVPFENSFSEFSTKYVQETTLSPSTLKFVRYGPFSSVSEFQEWYRDTQMESTMQWFAIVLASACMIRRKKVRSVADDGNKINDHKGEEMDEMEEFEAVKGTVAGATALLNASVRDSSVEIGHVMIFSQFQRTFVGTQAHGLLLQHLLEPSPIGLHLRRVEWYANSLNQPSINAAKRLGFQFEGITRWHRVLPEGKLGAGSDKVEGKVQDSVPGSDVEGRNIGPARHTAVLSHCWDDWLVGGRDKIKSLMVRV